MTESKPKSGDFPVAVFKVPQWFIGAVAAFVAVAVAMSGGFVWIGEKVDSGRMESIVVCQQKLESHEVLESKTYASRDQVIEMRAALNSVTHRLATLEEAVKAGFDRIDSSRELDRDRDRSRKIR